MSQEKRKADDDVDTERKTKKSLAEAPTGKTEKTFQSFGYDYINEYVEQYQKKYVKQHKENSAWNETQLNLIVEIFINFIDCYTEEFLNADFPLDPVWIFEKLLALNTHVQEHGFSRGDSRVKELEEPIFQFQEFTKERRLIRFTIIELISAPHQFIREEWFFSIDLDRFDKKAATDEEWLKMRKQQIKELHAIVSELLSTAINRIKETDTYQQAVASGKRHYMPEESASPKEAKPTSLSASSTLTSTLPPTSSPTRGAGLFDSSLATSHSQISSSSSQENSGSNSSMGFSKSNEE